MTPQSKPSPSESASVYTFGTKQGVNNRGARGERKREEEQERICACQQGNMTLDGPCGCKKKHTPLFSFDASNCLSFGIIIWTLTFGSKVGGITIDAHSHTYIYTLLHLFNIQQSSCDSNNQRLSMIEDGRDQKKRPHEP